MRHPPIRFLLPAGLAAGLALLSPPGGIARAQTSSPAATPTAAATPVDEELSDEEAKELEEIERALGGSTPTSTPASPAASRPVGAAAMVQSMNPDLSFIVDVAAAAFTAPEPLQTGGHDPAKSGFALQQVELSASKSVDPYFRFDGSIVFSQFGVEVEEAYATTMALPYRLQARAGQMLTRFGRINATHPHTWDFVDQPFAIGRVFGGEANRGVGVEVSWLAPLSWHSEWIVSTTEAAGASTARSFYGGNDLGVVSPLDVQTTLASKHFFELSDDLSLLAGISAATGPNASGYRNRTDVVGTDLFLKWRPLASTRWTRVTFQTEWLYRRRQVPEDVLADVSGYAQGVWRFAQRWETGLRWEYGTPARNLAGKIVLDPLDPYWTDDRHRTSAQLTFRPTEFSRLRLQGAVDAPAWQRTPDASLMLSLEISAGAHGAHAF